MNEYSKLITYHIEKGVKQYEQLDIDVQFELAGQYILCEMKRADTWEVITDTNENIPAILAYFMIDLDLDKGLELAETLGKIAREYLEDKLKKDFEEAVQRHESELNNAA